ncbi:MAG: putative Fe-S cluster assembly protein SufT [Verrucomicrobiae bacterium]|nr:putative Fe-S cluster assembly protein SufT [Verrucomicrobiae bacterium]
MSDHDEVQLSRECAAVAIPAGHATKLPQGTTGVVTQALGGSYTLMTPMGLFRIDGRDGDAIGRAVLGGEAQKRAAEGAFNEELIWEQMRSCFDPEIPVNIVDLGLIYSVAVEEREGGGRKVGVKMTLTAPGCGMGEIIRQDVVNRVASVPGVDEVDVEMVFDPPWNQGMMTEAARLQLGLL